jgi:hypothetical protein
MKSLLVDPAIAFDGSTQILANFETLSDLTGKHTLTSIAGASLDTSLKRSGLSSLNCSGGCVYTEMATSQPFLSGTADFTIECWIYPTAACLTGSQWGRGLWGVYANTTATTPRGQLRIAGTTLNMYFNETGAGILGGSGTYSASGVIIANAWQHVAFVKSGTTYKTYVNGISVMSATSAASIVTRPYLEIGRCKDGTQSNFLGNIDDFRLTSSARYLSNFTPV